MSDEIKDSAQELKENSGALAQVPLKGNRMMPKFCAVCSPIVIKNRVKALKNHQVKINHQLAGFFEEVHKLDCQYQSILQGLYDKRSDIVNGKVEPTDEDCIWPVDAEDPFCDKFQAIALSKKQVDAEDPFCDKFQAIALSRKLIKGFADIQKIDESAKGIPEFWVTVFKNNNDLKSNVEPHDWPILKHLKDIKLIMNEDEHWFRLDFEFEDNDFFTNKVISKTYFMKIQVDEESPLMYKGPEVLKCEGTQIHWKPGMNATVYISKRVQKQSGKKTVVTKTIPVNSFFNFFQPPLVKDGEKVDDEKEMELEYHFDLGQLFREHVVPLAGLFFTGEYVKDYENEFEGED